MATLCIISRVLAHGMTTLNTFPVFANTVSRVKKHVSSVAICASRDAGTRCQGSETRFQVSQNALPGFRYTFPGFGYAFPGLRDHGMMSLGIGKMSLNTFPDCGCKFHWPGKTPASGRIPQPCQQSTINPSPRHTTCSRSSERYSAPPMSETLTPMMQQYHGIRRTLPVDTLLMFRLGDF